MYRMTDEEFEAAIAEALDAMPDQFMEALQNVAIVWEEEPSAYHLGYDEEWDEESWGAEGEGELAADTLAELGAESTAAAEDAEDEFDDLLGLFDGLSLVERANGYDDDIPDVITIFQGAPRALLQQPRGNRGRSRQDHHPRAGPLLRPRRGPTGRYGV